MSRGLNRKRAVPNDLARLQPIRWGKDSGTVAPSPLRGEGWGGGELAGHPIFRLQMVQGLLVNAVAKPGLINPGLINNAAMFSVQQPLSSGAGVMKGITTPLLACSC